MAQLGRPTIDLDAVKPLIHVQYCERGLSLLDIVRYLNTNYNIQVTARTLTRRLQICGFTKYTSRIPATLLATLQARIVQLFYHHMLTDEEIQRVLQGEGYGKISLVMQDRAPADRANNRQAEETKHITAQTLTPSKLFGAF